MKAGTNLEKVLDGGVLRLLRRLDLPKALVPKSS